MKKDWFYNFRGKIAMPLFDKKNIYIYIYIYICVSYQPKKSADLELR